MIRTLPADERVLAIQPATGSHVGTVLGRAPAPGHTDHLLILTMSCTSPASDALATAGHRELQVPLALISPATAPATSPLTGGFHASLSESTGAVRGPCSQIFCVGGMHACTHHWRSLLARHGERARSHRYAAKWIDTLGNNWVRPSRVARAFAGAFKVVAWHSQRPVGRYSP